MAVYRITVPPSPTAQPLFVSGNDTERRCDSVCEGQDSQVIPPSTECSVVPKEPTAHPSIASWKTTSHKKRPVSESWRVQVLPPSVVRATMPSVRYFTNCTPLPAPWALPRHPAIQPFRSSRKKTLFAPISTPLTPFSSSHDSPPSVVENTAPDLKDTQPRRWSEKWASDRGRVFSKKCRFQVMPPSVVLRAKLPLSVMIRPSVSVVEVDSYEILAEGCVLALDCPCIAAIPGVEDESQLSDDPAVRLVYEVHAVQGEFIPGCLLYPRIAAVGGGDYCASFADRPAVRVVNEHHIVEGIRYARVLQFPESGVGLRGRFAAVGFACEINRAYDEGNQEQ